MNDDDEKDINLISYRLTQLENGLKTVQDTLHNISEQLANITTLQARVTFLEADMARVKEGISDLQNLPYKKDAGKWTKFISWILQALTLAVMTILLAKVGLK